MNGRTIHLHGGVHRIYGDVSHVEMHGGVLYVYGRVRTYAQRGGIVNRFDERQTKVEYRDRVIVQHDPADKEEIARLKAELKNAEEGRSEWFRRYADAAREIGQLKREIEASDRTKLMRRIEELEEKLQKAENRERVAVMARTDAENKLRNAHQLAWDEFRPTKEACKRLYENLKVFLDCEDEREDGAAVIQQQTGH